MKTKLLLTALFLSSFLAFAQKKITKTGEIRFEASVPSFEEVKGVNKTATFVLNTETGEIASLALIKGFRFKIALMEEHFNENYLESDKYPKATFKGKVYAFEANELTDSFKDYIIKGMLEIHGKSKEVTIPARIRKAGDGIEISGHFSVNSDDYKIQIPKVVSNKVSKKVDITLHSILK